MTPPALPRFAELAADPDPPLDQLALALAAEFGEVDAAGALARLDGLGAELTDAVASVAPAAGAPELTPRTALGLCTGLIGRRHGFAGDRRHYDDPANSMLDIVLRRRRGLPILLSVVYVEAARRAGIPLAGVGLAGHFVVGHFGCDPPALIDPFDGGAPLPEPSGPALPWPPPQIAWRMLNNLVQSFERRGDLAAAIRAAEMRLALPAVGASPQLMEAELGALRARLN